MPQVAREGTCAPRRSERLKSKSENRDITGTCLHTDRITPKSTTGTQEPPKLASQSTYVPEKPASLSNGQIGRAAIACEAPREDYEEFIKWIYQQPAKQHDVEVAPMLERKK